MTLACVFVANYCKTTGAGSRRYGLNGRCPFFRVSSILTAISPAQMSRNRRIKPWSSENDKKEERAHRPREFQTVDNQIFIVTKPRFQGLCGGVIQTGGQLPLRKDPGNEEGPSIFSQKLRKFRFEVKWKGNFPENLFENCEQPPEVVLFFSSEQNSRNALTICENPSVSRPLLKRSSKICGIECYVVNGKRHSQPVGH